MLSELWSDLRYRLRVVLRRNAVERELDEELQFHVAREAAAYERGGMARGDAVRRARIAFGGIEQTKEASRDARGTVRLEQLAQDLRYAVRSLAKQRGFTAAVVLTLAIGIGANTAIFTAVDALLLRTLPVPHPEQLVIIGDPGGVHSSWSGSPEWKYVSYPLWADVRDRNTVLSGVFASGALDDPNVRIDQGQGSAGAAVEHPRTRLVSSNFFSVLEVRPLLGRTFVPGDDAAHRRDPVAVISYDYWRTHFADDRGNANASPLGRVIRVNDVPVTIVGVAPRGFTGELIGETTDLWLPLSMQPAFEPRHDRIDTREASWLQMMGRLAPGVTLARARSALATIEAQSIREHLTGVALSRFEEDLKEQPVRVEPGAHGFSAQRDEYGRALVVLMAAVMLVILVVCANVSNLMLARAAARAREMTLRLTLGAARRRLLQQVLIESLVLAAAAGMLGLLAAGAGTRVLLATVSSSDLPVDIDLAPDLHVLVFTAVMTLACAVLFGLVPGFRATRVDPATALRASGGGRTVAGGGARVGRVPVGRLLVIAQVGLSTTLLIGAGLLVRSMQRLLTADLGFDRDHVLEAYVAAGRTDYAGARLAALRRDLAERVGRLPGVDAASYSVEGVFSGGSSGGHVTVGGYVAQADSERQVYYDQVGPGFFHAIGGHIVRGRDVTEADTKPGGGGAAINETMAKYYFRDRDPIGGTVTLHGVTSTIVAVVRDVEERSVRAKPVRRLYVASLEPARHPEGFELLVHVAGDPSKYVAPVRAAIGQADRTIPLDITPVSDLVRQSLSEDALLMRVTVFFGVLALVLAALGLYGVTAYSTAQRTGEFGVRLALGATGADVARLVLREAVMLSVIGVIVGVPAGVAAGRLIRREVFGVSLIDAPSLSAAVLVLVLSAVVASYLPARRAARVGPLKALRAE